MIEAFANALPASLTQHLPALQIVVPMLSGPICALTRSAKAAWLVALAVTGWCLFNAVALLGLVLSDGPISYALGGWAAPLGIEYRVDAANAFVLVFITLIGAVVVPYAPKSIATELHGVSGQKHLFYAMLMLCMTGLMGMTITGDAFNVFVFLEISSLSSYALIALGRSRRALTAAFRYLIAGTIGGTFILIGIGLLYMMTGTLNMADLADRLTLVSDNKAVLSAFAFICVGTGIKLALFPLHLWLPDAYTYAPSVVTTFLASTATKVSYYVLLRVVFTLFGAAVVFDRLNLDAPLLFMGLAAAFAGSLVAIWQDNVKRLLAYSSIAQVGYMVVGLSLGNQTGLTGGIVHLFNHALMKGAMFMALGCMLYRGGSVHIKDLAGIGHRMPWTTAAFVLGGLSLIGVPTTVGFVSKWYLVLGALEADLPIVAVLMLLSSLLAVVYVGRVAEVAYFQPSPPGARTGEAPLSMLVPTWVLVAGIFAFGINGAGTSKVAAEAARSLFQTEHQVPAALLEEPAPGHDETGHGGGGH